MFDVNDQPEEQRVARASSDSTEEKRPGFPVDPRRVLYGIRSKATWLVLLVVLAGVVGAGTGKYLIRKQYSATATVLWEPPPEARADANRELATLAQSVKLPTNLSRVRENLALPTTLEALASRIDVKLGQQSMLISVSASAKEPDEAAAVANSLVEVFVAAQRDLAADRLTEVVTALRSSLAESERALAASRKAYDDFRSANRIGDLSVEVQSAIEEVARLRVASNNARVELEELTAREASLRASRDAAPGKVVSSETQEDPVTSRLAAVEAELAQAQARLTADHPRVRALEAQVAALRGQRNEANPAVTSRVVARSSVRDSLATQVAELSALRKSIEQRKLTLDQVTEGAEQRAAHLTAAEAEAAQLLANLKVDQGHVDSLLQKIATAEDDARVATSGFQVVSKAMPPPWPDKPTGRIVAAAIPLATLVLMLVGFTLRELLPLRVKGGNEAAFWANAPVLWTTAWPAGPEHETRDVVRELADVLEQREGVVGMTTFRKGDEALELAELVARRLERRGVGCAVTDERNRPAPETDMDAAEVMEHRSVGADLELLRGEAPLVLVVLPPLDEASVVRAARRWLDGLLVVVPSAASGPFELLSLRSALGFERTGLAMVVTGVPAWLLSPASRAFGDSVRTWFREVGERPTVRRHTTG